MQKLEKKTDSALQDKTDWKRLESMTDADIQRGIDSDPDSAPALSYKEIKASYKPHPPRIKR